MEKLTERLIIRKDNTIDHIEYKTDINSSSRRKNGYLDGDYTYHLSYDDKGTCQYKNGVRHGLQKVIDYKNYTESNFKNGSLHGYKINYRKGTILEYSEWEENKRHGISKEYSNGVLSKSVEYKNNNKHGLSIDYWSDGITIMNKINYKDGDMHGWSSSYNKYGVLKSKVRFRYGLILKSTFKRY